jgi:hypothetical protein
MSGGLHYRPQFSHYGPVLVMPVKDLANESFGSLHSKAKN